MNQAVILAGGEGSRLFPMTSWTPKPLLPVRGVPLLIHILRKLKAEGWDDVVICINEAHREEFEYHVSTLTDDMKVRLSTHPRSEEIGTAGELAAAARFLHGEYLLVYYGDVLSHVDTGAMRREYEAFEARPAAYLAVAMKYKTDKGIVSLQDGQVSEIREKPELELPNLVGIDILRSDVLEQISIGEDLHKDVLPRLLAGGWVAAHVVDDDFIDVGSIDGYRRAQAWR